jgi:hypothetical protein
MASHKLANGRNHQPTAGTTSQRPEPPANGENQANGENRNQREGRSGGSGGSSPRASTAGHRRSRPKADEQQE